MRTQRLLSSGWNVQANASHSSWSPGERSVTLFSPSPDGLWSARALLCSTADLPRFSNNYMNSVNRVFLIGLARAFAGAILFSLPLMMTMEMWWLGFYMSPWRMGLLVLAAVPLLTGLAYYSGFEDRVGLKGALVDAFVAYAVGFVNAALVLTLMAIVWGEMSIQEIAGKITLQSIPGGFGAVIATSQLGGKPKKDNRRSDAETDESSDGSRKSDLDRGLQNYFRELFLMIAGALYFAFNVAPTEEMMVISFKMTAWHAIAMMLVSIVAMHAFVYVVKFHGQKSKPEEHSWWRVFLRFTIVGYALAQLVSLYCLWTFGRADGIALSQVVVTMVVLGFPAAMGAAAARLIL